MVASRSRQSVDLEVGAGGREQGEEGAREGATSQEELGGGLLQLVQGIINIYICRYVEKLQINHCSTE